MPNTFFSYKEKKSESWNGFNITVWYTLYLFACIKWNGNISTTSDFSNSSEESNGVRIVLLLEIVYSM